MLLVAMGNPCSLVLIDSPVCPPAEWLYAPWAFKIHFCGATKITSWIFFLGGEGGGEGGWGVSPDHLVCPLMTSSTCLLDFSREWLQGMACFYDYHKKEKEAYVINLSSIQYIKCNINILKSDPSDATSVLLQKASSLQALSVYVLTSKMALN